MASLDTLPVELQFEIFSYLVQPLNFHRHVPTAPTTHQEFIVTEGLRTDRGILRRHPYNNIAATCQQLRSSVEAFCLHLLKGTQQSDTPILRMPKSIPKSDWNTLVADRAKKGGTKRIEVAHRQRWLKGVFNHCIFCRRKTKRKAVFNRLMWCDAKCDVEQYGRLISKSEAAAAHKVLEIHWRTPQLVFPNDTDLRPLRVALCNTSTCAETTLLKEKEVLQMADYIKKHDPKGDMLKQARRRLKQERAAEEQREVIRAEERFAQQFGPWFQDSAAEAPSDEACRKVASFMRGKVQTQIGIFRNMLENSFADAAAKRRVFSAFPNAIPAKLRPLCKVDILDHGDNTLYRFGIWRPNLESSGGDNRHDSSSFIPIFVLSDSRKDDK